MLYHSLINSRVQYGIIAWERAASCHLQPISVVLSRAMRCLNTDKLLTNKVITIYNMQKILQPKYTFNLAVSKIMYNHTTSQLPATFNNYFKLITDVHSYNTRQIKTRQFVTLWRPAEKKLPSVESRCMTYSYFNFPKPTVESRALCFPLQGTIISY